jgi:hypothetical protein
MNFIPSADDQQRLSNEYFNAVRTAPQPATALVRPEIPSAVTLSHFLASAKSPEFLIEPLLQRGYLYTLTAKTFHGKTTVLVYLSLCIAAGMSFANLPTKQGRVVLFAGENPDDTASKLLVACECWRLEPADLPITVIPGAFDLAGGLEKALAEASSNGPVALVGIDTSAAYRSDPDEDNNQASKCWGQTLRRFTSLPGSPAVVVPTHPIKSAEQTNLVPRGGGGFLNEVDGNLTLWTEKLHSATPTTVLHWCGKQRGPNFPPISISLINQAHPTWCSHDGSPVELKVAVPSDDRDLVQTGTTSSLDAKTTALLTHVKDLMDTHSELMQPETEAPIARCLSRDILRAALIRSGWFDQAPLSENGKLKSKSYGFENGELKKLVRRQILSFNRNFVWLN